MTGAIEVLHQAKEMFGGKVEVKFCAPKKPGGEPTIEMFNVNSKPLDSARVPRRNAALQAQLDFWGYQSGGPTIKTIPRAILVRANMVI